MVPEPKSFARITPRDEVETAQLSRTGSWQGVFLAFEGVSSGTLGAHRTGRRACLSNWEGGNKEA